MKWIPKGSLHFSYVLSLPSPLAPSFASSPGEFHLKFSLSKNPFHHPLELKNNTLWKKRRRSQTPQTNPFHNHFFQCKYLRFHFWVKPGWSWLMVNQKNVCFKPRSFKAKGILCSQLRELLERTENTIYGQGLVSHAQQWPETSGELTKLGQKRHQECRIYGISGRTPEIRRKIKKPIQQLCWNQLSLSKR